MHTGFFDQNCTCTCNICKPHGEIATPCIANNNVVSGVRNMCEHILCPNGRTDEFHKLECIQGNCFNYDISTLQFYLREVDNNTNTIVPRHQFEKVSVGRLNDGKNRYALRLEYKQTPPHQLVTFLKPKLVEFIIHNFEAKWQDNMFKMCLESLTTD